MVQLYGFYKDTLQIERHKCIKNKRMEKDVLGKQYPKEGLSGYNKIRQINFKAKIVTSMKDI